MTRTFQLQRDTDVSGVSGTGIVADGIVFGDGTTVLRWHGEYASTVVWPSFEAAIAVHGHDGKTRPVWSDEPAARSLDGEYSSRGFFHWTPTETTYGETVHVYESSAAMAPHMWLRITKDEDITAHLTAEQARTVRDQISAWLERANR